MLGFGLFATDQSHKETLSLCASDSVKLFVATLLVHHDSVVHLEQVYSLLDFDTFQPLPFQSALCFITIEFSMTRLIWSESLSCLVAAVDS